MKRSNDENRWTMTIDVRWMNKCISTLLYLLCGGLSMQNEEEKDEEAPTVRKELVNMP